MSVSQEQAWRGEASGAVEPASAWGALVSDEESVSDVAWASVSDVASAPVWGGVREA